jgi:hypothetical protein
MADDEPLLVFHEPRPFKFSWNTFLRFAGPGLLMSVAYVVSRGEQTQPNWNYQLDVPAKGLLSVAPPGAHSLPAPLTCRTHWPSLRVALSCEERPGAAAPLQDPGNLESDLQLGAAAGYSLLWLMLWSIIMVRRSCCCPRLLLLLRLLQHLTVTALGPGLVAGGWLASIARPGALCVTQPEIRCVGLLADMLSLPPPPFAAFRATSCRCRRPSWGW